jgi:hypothetical protein
LIIRAFTARPWRIAANFAKLPELPQRPSQRRARDE